MSPSIFGCLTVGSVVLSIVSVSVVLYCAGSGVKSVVVVLFALSFNWFACVHVCICSRYGCTCCCAMRGCVCVESIVMSSAYVVSVMLSLCGVGMSAVYMLKSVGDSTPP